MMNWKKKWSGFLNESTDTYPFPDMNQGQYALAAFTGLAEAHRSHADTVSKQVAGDIVKYLKNDLDLEDENADSLSDEYFIPGADKSFNLEFVIESGKTATGLPFSIDSGVYPEGPSPLIDIKMVFDTRYPIINSLEDIYFKLIEDVRHEIEHLIGQLGGEPANSVADHYLDKGEVPSMVRGLHLRARKMKIPTADMFRKELQPYLQGGEITSEESEQILRAWEEELDKIQAKGK